MRIENVAVETATEQYKTLARHDLIVQQIGLRATAHALEFLLKHGATEANVREMLGALQQQLFVLHETAHARGIQLPGYQ